MASQQFTSTRPDVVVLDARRFDEFHTMSIPGGTSVPGAELALRVRELAPDPATRVIVNCAGRTRSIIGTQSLVNAGVDCAPKAVGKEELPLADFVRRPELFRDFLHSLMPDAGQRAKTVAG